MKVALILIIFVAVIAWFSKRELFVLAGNFKTSGLHPEVKARADRVVTEANERFKEYNLKVAVFEGLRTSDRQQNVINSGNSFIDNPLRSYHVWGLAVDIVFLDKNGNWTWSPVAECGDGLLDRFLCPSSDTLWYQLGGIVEKHGFEWGGRWSTFDGAHAQYTRLGRVDDFIANYGSPSNWFASHVFTQAEVA